MKPKAHGLERFPSSKRGAIGECLRGLVLAALDFDHVEGDLGATEKAAAVLLVLTCENRAFETDLQSVATVFRQRPIATVMVKVGMPEKGHLVRADLVPFTVDYCRFDLETGNQAAVGGVTDSDLDMRVLVASAALLVMPSLRLLDNRLARRGLVFGIAWVILAPMFFFFPDGWNGGYERLLALMLLGWARPCHSLFCAMLERR